MLINLYRRELFDNDALKEACVHKHGRNMDLTDLKAIHPASKTPDLFEAITTFKFLIAHHTLLK